MNYRKFSEEFLSTFAGQKIPKEGTCFDYFYDWQTDGFKDWSTRVRASARRDTGGVNCVHLYSQQVLCLTLR